MRVISRGPLRNFAGRFNDAEEALNSWFYVMRHNDYANPHDLKEQFGSASLLGDGLVVFNICGNKYRLLAHVRYDVGIVFVKGVMTHAEYDVWSAAEVRR